MTTATKITLDQYHAIYDRESGWEYWFGEAVRKPMPTWVHCILKVILGELLHKAGYYSGSELDLRISSDWQPRPDVAGSLTIEEPYPTKPVEVVIEILSDDQSQYIAEKCSHYDRIGIRQIFVSDPKSRLIYEWKRTALTPIPDICLGNGSIILGVEIWDELDRRMLKR